MAKTYGGYPQAAKNRAKAALKHKEEKGTSCGTSVGWTRARQLSKGQSLTCSVPSRFCLVLRLKIKVPSRVYHVRCLGRRQHEGVV